MADNPWKMDWIKIDTDLLLKELDQWSGYLDKEIQLVNSIHLTSNTEKFTMKKQKVSETTQHKLHVNTPATEFDFIVKKHQYDYFNVKPVTEYGLCFDCYPYKTYTFDLSEKQYVEFTEIFKKIATIYEKKKQLFSKNKCEMCGKIIKLIGGNIIDPNRKKNN